MEMIVIPEIKHEKIMEKMPVSCPVSKLPDWKRMKMKNCRTANLSTGAQFIRFGNHRFCQRFTLNQTEKETLKKSWIEANIIWQQMKAHNPSII